jgi:hypothetical protein
VGLDLSGSIKRRVQSCGKHGKEDLGLTGGGGVGEKYQNLSIKFSKWNRHQLAKTRKCIRRDVTNSVVYQTLLG